MLFIAAIKKMIEETYTIYLPKKTHPFCYISLEINSNNVDVNVHPTKHEVRFLHEDSIIEKVKLALDEKLAGDSASRTFYLQARLPKVDVTEETLKEVLPEFEKENSGKQKKIHQRELIRTDSSDQKLDKFNFTIHTAMNVVRSNNSEQMAESSLQTENILELEISNDIKNNIATDDISVDVQKIDITNKNAFFKQKDELHEKHLQNNESGHLNTITNQSTQSILSEAIASTSNNNIPTNNINLNTYREVLLMSESDSDDSSNEKQYGINKCNDSIAKNACKRVYQYFGNKNIEDLKIKLPQIKPIINIQEQNNDNKMEQYNKQCTTDNVDYISQPNVIKENKSIQEFKSYSVNNFRREVKLTSVLKLRKEVEDNCHQGLREILSNLIFVGCIDEISTLIQSGVNLYICNTKKLA